MPLSTPDASVTIADIARRYRKERPSDHRIPDYLIELRNTPMRHLLTLAEEWGIDFDAVGNVNASKSDLANAIYMKEQEHSTMTTRKSAWSEDVFECAIYRFYFEGSDVTSIGAVYDNSDEIKMVAFTNTVSAIELSEVLPEIVKFDLVAEV